MSRELLVDFICAPGDIVVCTAALRDYALAHPEQRVVYVGVYKELFANNPHVSCRRESSNPAERITICYAEGQRLVGIGGYHDHFLTWFHEDIYRKTGKQVPLTEPKPALYLSADRIARRPIDGRYWLLLAGGKTDMTVKHWGFDSYRLLVSALRERGIATVQTGAANDIHPNAGCDLNLVGWGNLLELLWQVYHADGVICPITCAMHVAAAFDKPCVVIAGGREDPCWEAYNHEYGQFPGTAQRLSVPHRFLHTIGELSCCKTNGCWVRKVQSTTEPACQQVVRGKQPLPRCMHDITVDTVLSAVMSYYADHTLPQPSGCTELNLLATEIGYR